MNFLGKDVSNLRRIDFSVRLLFIPFSVASIWIAVTNQEDNPDYGKLEFNNMIGLKYMVCVSALSGVYAVFAAVCSYFRFLVTKAWLFFITDQVLAYLMVTSLAAFVEFLYIAYNGDQVVSWSEACISYGKFCSRLKVALALHVFSVFCFLVLAVVSAYRLFKRFEPPYVPNSKDSEQQRRS